MILESCIVQSLVTGRSQQGKVLAKEKRKMLMLWTLACFKGEVEDSVVDTEATEITYPTAESVLLYQGHGGMSGDQSGNGGWRNAAEAITSQYGFAVEERSSLGNLSQFRTVFMISPGQKEDVVLGANAVADVQAGLDAGTRLVIMAGQDNCDGRAINTLLEDLGAPMRLTGKVATAPVLTDPGSGLQMSKDIDEGVLLSTPCLVETNGADVVLFETREIYAASWRGGWGGDVVLIGDHRFADDTGKLGNRDNLQFVFNLVEVDPDFE
ncbi:MAG: hypothetical protein ACI9VR_002158 [Cognaticolwellia sp.]|jgi:hypothetical protein